MELQADGEMGYAFDSEAIPFAVITTDSTDNNGDVIQVISLTVNEQGAYLGEHVLLSLQCHFAGEPLSERKLIWMSNHSIVQVPRPTGLGTDVQFDFVPEMGPLPVWEEGLEILRLISRDEEWGEAFQQLDGGLVIVDNIPS